MSEDEKPLAQLSETHLRRRYRAERWFRAAGATAVSLALCALGALLLGTLRTGIPGFFRYELALEVSLLPERLELPERFTPQDLEKANFAGAVRSALQERLPQAQGRAELRELRALLSSGAEFAVRDAVLEHPDWVGSVRPFELPLSANANLVLKGQIPAGAPEQERPLSEAQLGWLEVLRGEGRLAQRLQRDFFSVGDSREPELAGLGGALLGSLFTIGLTLLLCVPVGVGAAVYLEEFAPKSRITRWIEVNINNLAAVPSIIFGLFGLAVFLNVFGVPRSAPLAGALVLSLMTLPTVIIASRAAIAAVPPSIRTGALAVGASQMQSVIHHVVPLALPGILTGTIIGMARALGETAPLLMIGMVAFIVDLPDGLRSPSTVLPVQVYLWADSPERGFAEKTGAAILVLIGFLMVMNLSAVVLRRRFERRW
jgi:phosphate transport system permease protein